MTNVERTPATYTGAAWDRTATINRWHQLWIWHLQRQTELNPDHPGNRTEPGQLTDLEKYRMAALAFLGQDSLRAAWIVEIDQEELKTRHDLVAALNVFNRYASALTAHLGLTSHDIVEAARQWAIADSMVAITRIARQLAVSLADKTDGYNTINTRTVGRTHGQPAQVIPYAMRWATLLEPLCYWLGRADLHEYLFRPPHGAVGTGADLIRTLGPTNRPEDNGPKRGHLRYEPGEYLGQVEIPEWWSESVDEPGTMGVTRQTYHRSYDLHIAGLLLQLGSIAHTWATDRRLEAMLGHGHEQASLTQVGSSAMPHKVNPVLSERIVGLWGVLVGYHTTAVQAATSEWLEGDVSGSSARRHWLPGIFATVEQILTNWAEAADRWQINRVQMSRDIDEHDLEIWTAAALDWLVQHGIDRTRAHEWVTLAAQTYDGQPPWPSVLARRIASHLGDNPDLAKDLVTRGWKAWSLHLAYAHHRIEQVVNFGRSFGDSDGQS